MYQVTTLTVVASLVANLFDAKFLLSPMGIRSIIFKISARIIASC